MLELHSKHWSWVVLVMGLGVTISACTNVTEVTTELKNIVETAAVAIDRAEARVLPTSPTLQLDSLRIPIYDVSLGTGDQLSGGSGAAEAVYVCQAEQHPDGCRVELVGDALENLFARTLSVAENDTTDIEAADIDGASSVRGIKPGSYTSIMVATCWEEGVFEAEIKLHTEINGQTWYTQADADVLTTDESLYAHTRISMTQCRNYTILNQPVEIESDPVTLNLYIDLRDIVHVIVPNENPPRGLCSGREGNDPVLCMMYPNVAGHIGETPPELERYLITANESGLTGAHIMGLYFDDDEPVGGFERNYWAEDLRDGIHFNSFKKVYTENGRLIVTDYRSDRTDTAEGDGNFTIVDFPRLDLGTDPQSGISVRDGDGQQRDIELTIQRID